MVTMTTIQPPLGLFAIFCKNVVKNHPISDASWDQNLQLQDPKRCEVIDLFLLISKRKLLWGWAHQILGGDKWNRDKTRKILNFPRI